LQELPQMYQEFFSQSNLPIKLQGLEEETMGTVYLTCASISLKSGEILKGAEFVAKAFRTDPFIIFRRFLRLKAIKFLYFILNKFTSWPSSIKSKY